MSTAHAFAELGLAPDASELEVKAAWRRLVSQWHPDRNDSADAVATMQRINKAFEAIRRSAFNGAGAPPADDVDDGDAAPAHPAAEPDRQPRRTINRKVKLTLEEAALGCTKVLHGKVTDTCQPCAGAGYRTLGSACSRCKGAGSLRQRAWFGWLDTLAECEACAGSGVVRPPCPACDGTGKSAPRRYRFNVRIPHGVRDGDLLHVDGRRPGPGQRPGDDDLDLRVEIEEHAFFRLDDDGTIRCTVPVDGFAWIANRPIDVPTLGGTQRLPLSRDRLLYRLAGQGFPVERRGRCGDQLVELVPIFPERLGADQEILIDQLIASSAGPNGRAADARLRAWNRELRAWQRGQPTGEG
ncbi:MAG TPA: DnaJ C-terminal domain-containing protein [Burkholderiaceae bacterium]|nr:DnaJ C-terminal domain-containing protein [Burkholderiaceae bacterium]